MKLIFASVRAFFDAEPDVFKGEDDPCAHPDDLPPKFAVSSLISSLKGVSGRLIRKRGYQACNASCRVDLSGHKVTLRIDVAAFRFLFCVSTLKISVPQAQTAKIPVKVRPVSRS
ncbi:MAG: hypothetical protein K5657_06125 [Desulfovibrio sp.]|nr:hypothetical protein [Desulfovibrio sp.]